MDNPNIILITVDCLRADKVGFLNKEVGYTPNMDKLAEESSFVCTAIAPSTHTRASIPSILTSQYSHEFFSRFLKDTRFKTFAEFLKEEGYITAAVHSNPLLSKYFGYDRGFDYFDDSLVMSMSLSTKFQKLGRISGKLNRLLSRYPYVSANKINKKVSKLLRNIKEPYFLWVHYMDCHGPYSLNRKYGYIDKFFSEKMWHKAIRSPELITSKEIEQLKYAYEGEVNYVDKYVGELTKNINTCSSNNIVVLTADHGEEFNEHGNFSHHPKLHRELIDVPLILKTPELGEIKKLNCTVSLLDILPTVLSFLNDKVNYSFMGESLKPLLTKGGGLSRKYVVSETNPENEFSLISFSSEEWKYIFKSDLTEDWLYNLSDDPYELNNVVDKNVEETKLFRKKAKKYISEHDISSNSFASLHINSDDEQIKSRLRSLGYID